MSECSVINFHYNNCNIIHCGGVARNLHVRNARRCAQKVSDPQLCSCTVHIYYHYLSISQYFVNVACFDMFTQPRRALECLREE